MNIVYARQPLPKTNTRNCGYVPNSIFLVGPTPREITGWWRKLWYGVGAISGLWPLPPPSWRPEALRILREELGFTGTVFVPEDESWGVQGNYDDQVWWEIDALGRSACIAVWLDRQLPHMPAFTTNTEVGLVLALRPHRCVFGFPPGAEKVRYQQTLAENIDRVSKAFGVRPLPLGQDHPTCHETLQEMLAAAAARADK